MEVPEEIKRILLQSLIHENGLEEEQLLSEWYSGLTSTEKEEIHPQAEKQIEARMLEVIKRFCDKAD